LLSTKRPNYFWVPVILLSNEYQRLYPGVLRGQGVKPISYVVPRLQMHEANLHSVLYLYGGIGGGDLIKHRDSFIFDMVFVRFTIFFN